MCGQLTWLSQGTSARAVLSLGQAVSLSVLFAERYVTRQPLLRVCCRGANVSQPCGVECVDRFLERKEAELSLSVFVVVSQPPGGQCSM